jgi:HTH-type transcriptional regulator / antitoxin HigA
VQIIGRVRLRDFWVDHERNETALRAWYQLVRGAKWDSAEALTAVFPYAQLHEDLVAFDLRGSSLFLITTIDFERSLVWVRDIQFHTEFRSDEWKSLAGEERSTDEDYSSLVEQFALRPLRSDDQLREAISRVDALLAKSNRSADEQDYLEVLSLLIEDYEYLHVPILSVSAAEIARTLIYEHRLSQAEIIPLLGGKQKAMELLKGTRPLDMRQATRCARHFKLPAETFMDPDDLEIELPKSPKRRR